jgi:DNA-binding NtrC family response regulator
MPIPFKQYRVFVVDDEDVIAFSLAMVLRVQGGFHARSFDKPADALNAAITDPPDVLLSDVVMPGMTGIELAVKMRTLCPDCKILLISGQASTADMLESARLSGHNFELLSKPVHPVELWANIRNLMESAPAVAPALEFTA